MVRSRIDTIFLIFPDVWGVEHALGSAGKSKFLEALVYWQRGKVVNRAMGKVRAGTLRTIFQMSFDISHFSFRKGDDGTVKRPPRIGRSLNDE